MKKNFKKSKIFTAVFLVVFVAAIGFVFADFSKTFNELSDNINTKTPTAILANAGLSSDFNVSIPVTYYDQNADQCINLYDLNSSEAIENRQFEWYECGYRNNAYETGLVESQLSENGLPIAASGGSLKANRGVKSSGFNRWFNSVDGVSQMRRSLFELSYSVEDKTYMFSDNNFHPTSTELFTMGLNIPFNAILSGDEYFEIFADDDTWVFVGDQLVIDLGGVHDAMQASFHIYGNGQVMYSIEGSAPEYSGVTLSENSATNIHIFHANRDSAGSKFSVKFSNMLLNISNTTIANSDEDGTVAYESVDSTYATPLGESYSKIADNSKTLMITVVAQLTILGILLIMTPIMAHFLIHRQK